MTLLQQIAEIRKTLGMTSTTRFDDMTTPGRRIWLTRYSKLSRDMRNDNKADNILAMHSSDIADIYQILPEEAAEFLKSHKN